MGSGSEGHNVRSDTIHPPRLLSNNIKICLWYFNYIFQWNINPSKYYSHLCFQRVQFHTNSFPAISINEVCCSYVYPSNEQPNFSLQFRPEMPADRYIILFLHCSKSYNSIQFITLTWRLCMNSIDQCAQQTFVEVERDL